MPTQMTLGDASARTRSAPHRVGVLIETVAGWTTYRQNLERTAQTVPDLAPHWHDITFYKPGGSIETLRERWLRFLPGRPAAIGRAVYEFHQGLREGPYDALLTNSTVTTLFSRRLRAVPTVLVVDSTQQQLDAMGEYGGPKPSYLREKVKLHLGRRVCDAAVLIVATSRWAKSGLVAEYGVPADKIVVNPHGVDLGFWRPGVGTSTSTRTVRRVLFVGGDFRRKGGELLLDWFRSRPGRDTELHVVTRENVERADGVVVHRDIQPNSPELLRLYQQSDVFVLPSLAEAFGIATIEAMGCGLPTVVSDAGGTSDIVDQGVNGFITKAQDRFALGSALERLLADDDLRASMGEQSRRIAEERFDLDKTARVTLGLLADIAASSHRR